MLDATKANNCDYDARNCILVDHRSNDGASIEASVRVR